MSKQWKQNIHDQLKDFSKKAPEGLLDDIKSELSHRGLSAAPVINKHPRIGLRIASVAAMILLLMGISYLFRWKEPTLLPTEQQSATFPTIEKVVLPTPMNSPENKPDSSATHLVAQTLKTITAQTDTLIIKEDSILQKATEEKKAEERPETSIKHPQEPSQPMGTNTQRSQWTHRPNKQKRSSFDLGFYYSGLLAHIDPIKTYDADMLVASPNERPGNDDKENKDSTIIASRATNQTFRRNKRGEKVKHHLPVRLGFSFRYYLNEQWNIQSGLTYSYLASDMSYNNIKTSYQTKQKLHYIGIPLQAGFRIWENKRSKGYISAGGQVEKLVSGKATTHYTMDEQTSGTLIENISDKKLLFSGLASIGAEYMVRKDLSLYVEPGIHYYFKNGNGLQTHYNEHPLNLNITIGFRFHWNK